MKLINLIKYMNEEYNDTSFTEDENPLGEDRLENTQSWLNEHGNPDFEYLQSLADDGSPRALEELKLIADDLDVDYHSSVSVDELVGKIRLSLSQSEGDENLTQ